MPPARRFPSTALAYVALSVVLAVAASACGASSEPGVAPEPEIGDQASEPEVADGIRTGWLRSIGEDEARIDFIEVLSGQEARERAVADGELTAGEDLPNDVYLVDEDGGPVSIRLADTVEGSIFDCTEGCTSVEIERADLLDGRAVPYGGAEPLVEVTVTDGRVTALAEQYLP